MSIKRDLNYYEERISDRNLLLKRVIVSFGKDNFVCIPCGGTRITGFTHFFTTLEEAEFVLRALADSGENFPDLRIENITNIVGEKMFIVKWGIPEPCRSDFRRQWDFEVAIAKQLGYNEECMVAHYERMITFQKQYY